MKHLIKIIRKYLSQSSMISSSSSIKFGLKKLKPLPAVVRSTESYLGWNLSSFIFYCPACRNMSCSGIQAPVSSLIVSSLVSASMAKSHTLSLSSSLERARTLSELGPQEIEVIAWPCHLILALGFLGFLISQIWNVPSSAPIAILYSFFQLQLITLISQSCASNL